MPEKLRPEPEDGAIEALASRQDAVAAAGSVAGVMVVMMAW